MNSLLFTHKGKDKKGENIIGRGIWHASFGVVGWFLIQVCLWREKSFLIALLIGGISIVKLELWRVRVAKGESQLKFAVFRQINDFVTKKIIRQGEETKFCATAKWYLYGCAIFWLVWYFISEAWIMAAVLILMGSVDPFAKLGKKWPIHRFNNWLVSGKSLGGFAFGFLAGAILLQLIPLAHWLWKPFLPETISWGYAYMVYGIGLISASLAELVSKERDNMWVPVISAVVMTVVHFCL